MPGKDYLGYDIIENYHKYNKLQTEFKLKETTDCLDRIEVMNTAFKLTSYYKTLLKRFPGVATEKAPLLFLKKCRNEFYDDSEKTILNVIACLSTASSKELKLPASVKDCATKCLSRIDDGGSEEDIFGLFDGFLSSVDNYTNELKGAAEDTTRHATPS